MTTVFTEGGQVRGGDQGSYRQAEGGELPKSPVTHFKYELSILLY